MSRMHDLPSGKPVTPPAADLSRSEPVASHTRRYLASNGMDGFRLHGARNLLLFTKGRITGRWRVVPLMYHPHGQDLLIVGSNQGSDEHPHWFRNLVEHPHAYVRVYDEVHEVHASVVDAAERDALWPGLTKMWPSYDRYQYSQSRTIPVIRLSKRTEK